MPFLVLKVVNQLTDDEMYRGFNSYKKAKPVLEKILTAAKKHKINIDITITNEAKTEKHRKKIKRRI